MNRDINEWIEIFENNNLKINITDVDVSELIEDLREFKDAFSDLHYSSTKLIEAMYEIEKINPIHTQL